MSEPLRVYIAGPYTPHNCNLHDAAKVAQLNTDKAVDIGNEIAAKGHFVYIPHLTHYMHIRASSKVPQEWWYDLTASFLNHYCNAIYYIGASQGADNELLLAKRLGLVVFTSLDEVPTVHKEEKKTEGQ